MTRPRHLPALSRYAGGIHRKTTGDRTAPTWRDAPETALPAANKAGFWCCDPFYHRHLAKAWHERVGDGTSALSRKATKNLQSESNKQWSIV